MQQHFAAKPSSAVNPPNQTSASHWHWHKAWAYLRSLMKLLLRGGGARRTRRGPRRAEERRRDQRVRISPPTAPNNDASASFTVEIYGKKFSLCDVSQRGLAFNVTGLNPYGFVPEEIVTTLVTLESAPMAMWLEIMNRHANGRVGCRVIVAPPAWYEEVRRILSPLHIAQSLHEITQAGPSPTAKTDRVRWFQGTTACHIFAWYHASGALSKVRVQLLAEVLEWSPAQGFQTGHLDAASATGPAPEPRSTGTTPSPAATPGATVQLQPQADPELIARIGRIVTDSAAAAALPAEITQLFAPPPAAP